MLCIGSLSYLQPILHATNAAGRRVSGRNRRHRQLNAQLFRRPQRTAALRCALAHRHRVHLVLGAVRIRSECDVLLEAHAEHVDLLVGAVARLQLQLDGVAGRVAGGRQAGGDEEWIGLAAAEEAAE